MGAAKCSIDGSDYIGVFATASEKHVFVGSQASGRSRQILVDTLEVKPVALSVFGTNLVGLFMKANSNGLIISNLIEDYELERLKEQKLDLKIGVLDSNLNAIGNNILANDKIAIINPDYNVHAKQQIRDVLDVEVLEYQIGGFKTIGANNILTNKGFALSNRAEDDEKESVDKLVGFNSIRTTANTGSLSIGLAAVCNSKGVVVGNETTGYELNRIIEALNVSD